MDNLKKSDRRKNMQNIRSTNTLIELKVRSALHKKGLRFRKYSKKLIGKPDIVFPSIKLAVFLDSCFWHKCRYHFTMPKSSKSYWVPKLNRNVQRAKEVNRKLRKQGWMVLRFWEHQVKKNLDYVINKIFSAVKTSKSS